MSLLGEKERKGAREWGGGNMKEKSIEEMRRENLS
jgi:hypothetical protein